AFGVFQSDHFVPWPWLRGFHDDGSRFRFEGGGRKAFAVRRRRRVRFIDVSEPVARRRSLALGDLEEALLNLLCDRTTPALAHRDAIDGTDRRYLCGCAGEEEFVCDIQRRTLDRAFFDGDTKFLADLDHAVAGDAGQDRRREWRRQND